MIHGAPTDLISEGTGPTVGAGTVTVFEPGCQASILGILFGFRARNPASIWGQAQGVPVAGNILQYTTSPADTGNGYKLIFFIIITADCRLIDVPRQSTIGPMPTTTNYAYPAQKELISLSQSTQMTPKDMIARVIDCSEQTR